jgi:hypothetical protein
MSNARLATSRQKASDLASHSTSAIGQISRPSSSYDQQKGSIVATAGPEAG